MAPVSRSRKRRAVTAVNEAVRTGTPAASSRTTGSHEAPSSLRSSTASGGGAAPKPLGPGSATVTAATVLGSAKRYSIQASEDASTARGSDTVALERAVAEPLHRLDRRGADDLVRDQRQPARVVADGDRQPVHDVDREPRPPPSAQVLKRAGDVGQGRRGGRPDPTRRSPTRRSSASRRPVAPTVHRRRSIRRTSRPSARARAPRRSARRGRGPRVQAGDPNTTGSGTTRGVPIPPSNTCTPRTPMRCSHSRSSRIPSGSTLPSIQCHHTRGRASSGGSVKRDQSSRIASSLIAPTAPYRGRSCRRTPRR